MGAVYGELLNAVLKLKDKGTSFGLTLARLRSTPEAISPLISEIEQQNNKLNQPQEEIERLVKEMEDCEILVCKCSEIRRWNYWTKLLYENRLLTMDNALLRLFNVDLQAQIARDQKETLLEIKKLHAKVEQLHSVVKKIKKDSGVSWPPLHAQKTRRIQYPGGDDIVLDIN